MPHDNQLASAAAAAAAVALAIISAAASGHGAEPAGTAPKPGGVPAVSRGIVLAGWRDEMNRDALRSWQWPLPHGRADLSVPRRGVLRLGLGPASESGQTPERPPRTYYWASAFRYVTVDLDRYPILAVRTSGVRGAETWWDAIVQEYTGGTGHGAETRASLADAQKPGLLLFDVPAATGITGRKQVRLRLNVAGLRPGGSVDYRYVRFIRREDRALLEARPDLQNVRLRP